VAAGADARAEPQHHQPVRLQPGEGVPFLLRVRKGSPPSLGAAYITTPSAGKSSRSPWLGNGERGPDRAGRTNQGRPSRDQPTERREVWRTTVHPGGTAASGGRAPRLINWLLTPTRRVNRNEHHNYEDPGWRAALASCPRPWAGHHVQRAEDLHGQLPLHPQNGTRRSCRPRTQILHEFRRGPDAVPLTTETGPSRAGREAEAVVPPALPGVLTARRAVHVIFFLGPWRSGGLLVWLPTRDRAAFLT